VPPPGPVPPPIDSPTRIVEINGQHAFHPPRITIVQGESIRWINTSGIVHTVTLDPGLARDPRSVQVPPGATPFNSGDIPPGGSFARTFVVPGLYRYFCIPHEMQGMVGEIEVLPR
jgi:plastocyanin